MKTAVGSLLVALGLAALLAGPAQAQSIRCGVHLIQSGVEDAPSQAEIQEKCGEPEEQRGLIWIYHLHGTKWELRFSIDGVLMSIKRL